MTRTPVSLLERLRSHLDREAWDRFVELYAPLLYRWLHHDFGLQDQDAQDVSQQVLLELVRELPRFRYDPAKGSFRGWLRAVLINRVRQFWRQQGRGPCLLPPEELQRKVEQLEAPGSAANRLWEQDHDSHVVRRALALLQVEFKPATWQAFWAVVVEGLDAREVAERLRLTPNAVRIAKHRVLGRLREEVAFLV